MAFIRHLRLTMSGEIRGGAAGTTVLERFAFRVNLSDPALAQDDFNLARATDYANDAAAFFGRPDTGISPAAVLTETKLARIGIDGKYVADPFIVGISATGGSFSGQKYPSQIALGVSLGTATRGARGRGRFYLPLPNFPLDDLKGISDANAVLCRDSVKVFIDDLNNTPGLDGVSPKVTVASTFGVNSDVTNVRVGRVLDTIRSRRAQLLEAYTGPVPVA